MGTSSTDRYVDPITSYDDAIFDYVALHEVGASEIRMLGPHTGRCGVNNLTTDVVAALCLRTAVKDLLLHRVRLWDRARNHHEA